MERCLWLERIPPQAGFEPRSLALQASTEPSEVPGLLEVPDIYKEAVLLMF